MLSMSGRPIVKSLVRGSAHIRTQARLMDEEQLRCGQPMDHPSMWRIAREQREYEIADIVFVLSSFARQTFEAEGVPLAKIRMLLLGSELKRFSATGDDIKRRRGRILAGQPLRVVTVGSFSFQKGALDLIEIASKLNGRMKFRMVGNIESKALRVRARNCIEFIPRQSQFSLPSIYREADLFLFPTIQDGYPVVLAQAQAAGLPSLATPNCSAPDILRENENGWILPIRNPAAFVKKLEWCDDNREALARMVRVTHENYKPRDWEAVASDLVNIYEEWFSQHLT